MDALLADDDRSLLDEALATWTRLGDEDGVARALWALGEHHAYRGDLAETEEMTTRALEIFERRGDPFWIAWTHFTRSLGRALGRDVPAAAADLSVCLRAFQETRDVSGLTLGEAALSSLSLIAGRDEDGYAIGAAAMRTISETGLHLATLWAAGDMPLVDFATGDPVLRAAIDRGRAWTREEGLERSIALSDRLAGEPITPVNG